MKDKLQPGTFADLPGQSSRTLRRQGMSRCSIPGSTKFPLYRSRTNPSGHGTMSKIPSN